MGDAAALAAAPALVTTLQGSAPARRRQPIPEAARLQLQSNHATLPKTTSSREASRRGVKRPRVEVITSEFLREGTRKSLSHVTRGRPTTHTGHGRPACLQVVAA